MARLTNTTLNALKADPILCGQVADLLGVTITSMAHYLRRNSPSLAKKPAREMIAAKMGVDADTLIEEKDAELV